MPNNDERLGGAAYKYFREEWIPGDAVDWGGVAVVGGQELGVVLNRGQVDVTLLCSHQEQVQLIRLERESTSAVQQLHPPVQFNVSQGPVEVDAELVAVPKRVLHDGPVGHPTIAGAAVEVLVAVQVVWGPVDLPTMYFVRQIVKKKFPKIKKVDLPDRLAVLSIARA